MRVSERTKPPSPIKIYENGLVFNNETTNNFITEWEIERKGRQLIRNIATGEKITLHNLPLVFSSSFNFGCIRYLLELCTSLKWDLSRTAMPHRHRQNRKTDEKQQQHRILEHEVLAASAAAACVQWILTLLAHLIMFYFSTFMSERFDLIWFNAILIYAQAASSGQVCVRSWILIFICSLSFPSLILMNSHTHFAVVVVLLWVWGDCYLCRSKCTRIEFV